MDRWTITLYIHKPYELLSNQTPVGGKIATLPRQYIKTMSPLIQSRVSAALYAHLSNSDSTLR